MSETAECWVLQYRVRPRGGRWGLWGMSRDYRRKETAVAECERRRAAARDDNEQWRVLHVTQEVVH